MSDRNTKRFVKDFNHRSRKKFDRKKKEERKQFQGRNIEVRNGDVNGAIKRLKKVLERMDFQKEVAKREYYEKPSTQRKRKKDQAIKKSNKERDKMIAKGEWMPTPITGQKHLKGKRQRRKAWMLKEKIKRLQSRRGR
jgi:small subunit ribosomal protein S21